MIISLRVKNGDPVMMIPENMVKITLLSTPTIEIWYLVGGLFSLTLLQYFNLFLTFLFDPVQYYFSEYILFCETL